MKRSLPCEISSQTRVSSFKEFGEFEECSMTMTMKTEMESQLARVKKDSIRGERKKTCAKVFLLARHLGSRLE